MEIVVENSEQKDNDFKEICEMLCELQSYKSKRYGSSWCKHGEAISIFGNTARKYDRIENIMKDFAQKQVPLPNPESEESVIETVADLAVYCILWSTWIKVNRPKEYYSWIERIRNAIRSQYD